MDKRRSHKPRLSVVPLWLWLGFAAVFRLIAWRGITDVIMPVYQYVAFAVAAAVVYLTPYFAAEDPVVLTHLPTRGVRTVYLRAGDVFAWLIAAVFAVLPSARCSKSGKYPQKIRISIVVPNNRL